MNTYVWLLAVAALIGASSAQAQTVEQVLGAVAGYHLGNSVGDGDGRRAARVVGAVVGYRLGGQVLNPQGMVRGSSACEYDVARCQTGFIAVDEPIRHVFPRGSDPHDYCRTQVPYEYRGNYGAARSWISGCVSRLQRYQAKLEEEAYLDGAGYR
jgi:uncharacterized protein YcfJ